MFVKPLLALCAVASTVIAGENNIKFVYTSSSYSTIRDSGSGAGQGFTLYDNNNEILFESDYPIGYAPCMMDTNHLRITSDCWEGTLDFSCGSDFDGTPGACSVYHPDGTETKGEVDSELTFTPLSAGIEGNCAGSITTYSEGECTKDSLVKIEERYRGKYEPA